MRGHLAPGGHLQPHLRHRSGAGPGQELVHPGGQPAHPLRRELPADRPRALPQGQPGDLPPERHRGQPQLRRPAARDHGLRVRAGHAGDSHPWALQRRLLRAQLPRRAHRQRAGLQQRPLRGGQQGLLPRLPRQVPARGRDLPPPERRVPGSADLPAGEPDRRAGPDERLPRGQRGHRQRPRQRRGRRQGHLLLRSQDDQILPGSGADPEERPHLPPLLPGGLPLRDGQSGAPGGEGRERGGRLRRGVRSGSLGGEAF